MAIKMVRMCDLLMWRQKHVSVLTAYMCERQDFTTLKVAADWHGMSQWYCRKLWQTRCVAMPSLMAARWVGQNSGPIFRCLWTKVHRIKFACVGATVVCNDFFLVDDVLLHSGDICDQIVKLCEITLKFSCFGKPNFGGRGNKPQISDRIL